MDKSLLEVNSMQIWDQYTMALEDVSNRLERFTAAMDAVGVPYALVGGQAVAVWVASRDPAAVRTTKDIDVLINRRDLPAARRAALSVDMDYFEVLGVGMFLDRGDPNPRHAVHIVWAGERVRAEYELPSPSLAETETPTENLRVVSPAALVRMKLLANRDQDRVHLRDMIELGLVERAMLQDLPPALAARLELLLAEAGR